MDPVFQMHLKRVRELSQQVRFVGDPLNPKVRAEQFWPVYEAFKAQNDHALALHAAFGTLERHPDGAPPELQDRLSWSLFAQGWIKFLPDADATRLLDVTQLADNYQEIPLPTLRDRHCGVCATELKVVAGARRVVCDGCGYRVEVEAPEIPCTNCAAPISFPENTATVKCPHCETMLSRVR
jgi:DNA-directed RNA polymerase subunit RPC12/RpoP